MKPILVTCYVNPDLDGVACATAYGEFLQKTGQNAVIGIIGKLSEETKYILDRFDFKYPTSIENADGFDEVILLDASDLVGLEGKIDPDKVIEIIDHRKVNESQKFINAKIQIELVGSAATLIGEKFIQNDIDISSRSAALICGAIISNTQNFRGSVTTERDKNVYTLINKTAKFGNDFWKDLFMSKSDLSGNKLEERIRGDFSWFEINNLKIGIAQLEMIGSKKLIDERGEEIIKILKDIKKEKDLDFILQSNIAIEDNKNYFICNNDKIQELLEKMFDIKFFGICAEKDGLLMRKQIVPLLKEVLEITK